MVGARATSRERIEYQYSADLQRYSQVEELKSLKLATTEGEREAIVQQYALNRSMLLLRYGQDLRALENSQGWQGVFGSRFAQLLAHDEEALRTWATSADQAFNLVSQSAVMMEGFLQKGFESFAQGMGQNIASAIVYKKSIAEAMRAAVASTLESLAAEALIYAIYSTGLGFLRLAQYDYPAATAAFTAAGVWGGVGAAAAVAGRVIAGAPGAQDKTAAGGAGSGSRGGSSAQDAAGVPVFDRRPMVTVNISGHVIGLNGAEQLAEIINDAVQNRDVRLLATQVKESGRAVA
jgi:hypothetical protein